MLETDQVWARGSFDLSPQRSIVNNWGPEEPHSSRKPFIGKRDVPVTNCRRRVLSSALNEPTAWNEKKNVTISISINGGRTVDYPPEILNNKILGCIATFVVRISSPVVEVNLS